MYTLTLIFQVVFVLANPTDGEIRTRNFSSFDACEKYGKVVEQKFAESMYTALRTGDKVQHLNVKFRCDPDGKKNTETGLG